MFDKILIANRGAIACRIQRTLKRMGIAGVAVYSDADRAARHVLEADEAVRLGPAAASDSYLRGDRIIEAALACGAGAIHPGYGFLSENPEFAAECEAAGIAFVGPTPAQMRDFGLKHRARELAAAAGVPLLPGSGLLSDVEMAAAEARRIGYPVMLKSTAGGGGIGMRLIHGEAGLAEAYASVDRLARANFKEAGLYLERYVEAARHIEVQLFGDGRGTVLALGERDCSVQRRNQKVIEETPAPGLTRLQRDRLLATAVRLGERVAYRSAGTVEFVYDTLREEFYFLEVNTRLQVEHGVTEAVTGIDLVEWMVRLAADELPPLASLYREPSGAAIQARLYAEDPHRNFQPCPGLLTAVRFPDDIRVDAWVEAGTEVPAHYDPMLAKLIGRGATREEARSRLIGALAATEIGGIETNRAYLAQVLAAPAFVRGEVTTRMLDTFAYRPRTVDVLEPGVQTTVQDWPGRQGFWSVGLPPSGPMDPLSMRLANRLVGNAEGDAALEITAVGPTLRFNGEFVVALCGAALAATLDDKPFPRWQAKTVPAGSTLHIGPLAGPGLRVYLAIAGGLAVPDYLGAKATFTLGRIGGHGGRTLRSGDVLPVGPALARLARTLPLAWCPEFSDEWRIGVLYGPHGAPDFFTAEDIETFFSTAWEVHYNSSRTGVRLIGPKPRWARPDGGEAGLHPSNIHDNPYAIGAIDFTGDMPVILGPDGPSLGGFVCPATVVQAELWKLGQLRPGDRVRFVPLGRQQANRLQLEQDFALVDLDRPTAPALPDAPIPLASPILAEAAADGDKPAVVVRQSGDANILLEMGPPVLDLELRFRIQSLMQAVEREIATGSLQGILDLTPGIRTLQLHFDPRAIDQSFLVDALMRIEEELPAVDDMEVESRIVHLPLSWDDPATRLAIDKYTQSVRPDAPWCPSNIEFIRRINGLENTDAVKRIVFDASYLVMGLGDVYLGAPVATPIDPRHRLVTTKYNPARTWTPENAVGIGGAYLCVYGMEGPGGYQFVGRTVQMWNRYRVTPDFADGFPWLLRFFDQIRFYPVAADELLQLREDFVTGRFRLAVEPTRFRLRDYRAFLAEAADSIAAFKASQQAAFDAERERWAAAGTDVTATDDTVAHAAADSELDLPDGARAVAAAVTGSVWKIEAAVGDLVAAGQTLLVVESMKMEIAVTAPCAGRLSHLFCAQGGPVTAGQDLLVIVETE